MKKVYTIIILLALNVICFSQDAVLPIIPQPQEVSIKSGYFKLSPQTKIVYNDETLKNDVEWFNDYLKKFYGFKLETVGEEPKSGTFISFEKPDFEAGYKEK